MARETPDLPDASRGGWSVAENQPFEAGPEPAPPPATDRYVPGNVLGRGGMGVVRVARDLSFGRNVALKELDPTQSGAPGAAERLSREAAITGRLDHPGIVAVHDVGRRPDGRPFYTMRLVRGRSLAQALADTPDELSRRALVRHLLAAAEAVAAAHEAGIVHRDLKPANILIGPHGETQVVDWGLASPTPAVGVLAIREDPGARGVLAAFGRAGRPKLLSETAGPSCTWSVMHPDGDRIWCGTADSVFDWSGGTTRWTVSMERVGGALVSGGLAVWDRPGRVWLLDPDDGSVISSHAELGWPWRPIVPPGRLFIDGRVWPSDSGHPHPCPQLQVTAVAAQVAGLCGDGTLRTWSPPGRQLTRIETQVGLADVVAAGDRLLLAGGNGELRVHALPGGAEVERYRVPDGPVIKGADRSPDGRAYALIMAGQTRLMTASDGALRPWPHGSAGRRLVWLNGGLVTSDLLSGLNRWTVLDAPPEKLNEPAVFGDLEVEPGRDSAVALDLDGTVWRLGATGPAEALASVPGAIAIASDGTTLALGLRDEIRWMKAGSASWHSIPVVGGLADLDLSPDGRRIAGSTLDGRALVWDLETARLLLVLAGHSERVSALAFLPDGDLATASWDHSARLWDVSGLARPVADLQGELRAAYGEQE